MKSKKMNNLYRISDFVPVDREFFPMGLFSLASQNKTEKEVYKEILIRERSSQSVRAVIRAYPDLGLPTTTDLIKTISLMKIINQNKLSKNEGLILNPIKINTNQLLRSIGYKYNPGKQSYIDVRRWLDRMSSTTIKLVGEGLTVDETRFYQEEGGWRFIDRYRFILINKSVETEVIKINNADLIEIFLHERVLHNLNYMRTNFLDYDAFLELNTHLSKLMAPLLQTWFYAGKGSFEKDYAALCKLFGAKIYKHRSQIHRQFKGTVEELIKMRFIKSFRIEQRKGGSGWKIMFTAGSHFQLAKTEQSFKYPKPSFENDLILDIPQEQPLTPNNSVSNQKPVVESVESNQNKFLNKNSNLIENELLNDNSNLIDINLAYDEFCLKKSYQVSPLISRSEFDKNFDDFLAEYFLLLDYFQKNLNTQIFESWFNNMIYAGFDKNNKIVFILNSSISIEWVTKNYSELMREALISLPGNIGATIKIKWVRYESRKNNCSLDREVIFEKIQIASFQESIQSISFDEFCQSEFSTSSQ